MMMKTVTRTQIIAGNWKMNYGPKQAADFAKETIPALVQIVQHQSQILCILCPPSISLEAVYHVLEGQPHPHMELGAQNMYFEEKGAYTGEISPPMVHELCSSVILGHSERRNYFGETDELVNKKAQAALHHGLRPIICIGEDQEQYDAGQTEQVIRSQVAHSLANFPASAVQRVVVAYEPIWAIGTGKASTPEGAGKVVALIRQLFGDLYGSEAANALRILYGGSVTGDNIDEYMAHPDIDGALVGGASIKPDFVEIVRTTVGLLQN